MAESLEAGFNEVVSSLKAAKKIADEIILDKNKLNEALRVELEKIKLDLLNKEQTVTLLSNEKIALQEKVEQLQEGEKNDKKQKTLELSQPIHVRNIIYGIPNLGKRKDEAIFDAINYFNKACPYCGKSLYDGHIRNFIEHDHFFPIARGGQDFPWNILPICTNCNRKKHDKMPYDFLSEDKYLICYQYLSTVREKYSNNLETGIVNIELVRGIIEKDKNIIEQYKSIGPLNELVNILFPDFFRIFGMHVGGHDNSLIGSW